MSNAIQTIAVGQARVHLIDLGTLTVDLAGWLRVPRDAWTPETAPYLAQPITMPAQVVAIELPGSVALVDACDPMSIANSTYAGPGYQTPPDLIEQLAAIGIAPKHVMRPKNCTEWNVSLFPSAETPSVADRSRRTHHGSVPISHTSHVLSCYNILKGS